MIEYIDLTIDFANRNDRINGITLDRVTTRSYDTAIKFRIEIIGHTLDETYDVKILTKYSYNQSQVLYKIGDNLEFLDGKLIYTPRVNLITEADYVRNYLYLSKDGLGLDMAQFNYQVDLSEIDKTALEVKLVYDQSYEALITEFEQALQNYKDSLPQADSVRDEIDVMLNQFGVDSQVKLNQYDTDAQQAIADNQTAFELAETGRQDNYEQAEDNRNQASNQAVADWTQDADALLETVEGNESARLNAEATRKTAETDRVSSETTRKTNETTRISNENARESAEVIRLANETSRINAENARAEFYEGFESELGKKANKQQEEWITPTLLNGWYAIRPGEPPQYMKDEFGFVHFRGTISKGTSATSNVAFQLPAEYRPSARTTFSISEISVSPSSLAFSIFTNGNVDFAGAPSSSWYAISYITFEAV